MIVDLIDVLIDLCGCVTFYMLPQHSSALQLSTLTVNQYKSSAIFHITLYTCTSFNGGFWSDKIESRMQVSKCDYPFSYGLLPAHERDIQQINVVWYSLTEPISSTLLYLNAPRAYFPMVWWPLPPPPSDRCFLIFHRTGDQDMAPNSLGWCTGVLRRVYTKLVAARWPTDSGMPLSESPSPLLHFWFFWLIVYSPLLHRHIVWPPMGL